MKRLILLLVALPTIAAAESYTGTARNNYDYRESASSEAQKDIPSGKSSYKVNFSISFKNNKATIKSKDEHLPGLLRLCREYKVGPKTASELIALIDKEVKK